MGTGWDPPTGPGTVRLFFAIRPPEPIRDAVLQATGTWVDGHPDIRVVPARNLHLTLAFLGEVEEELTGRLQRDLGQVVAEHAGFELKTADWRCFPPRGRPRVYWLGISPSLARDALAAATRQRMNWLRPDLAERGFRPHLTVARVSRRQTVPLPRLPPQFGPSLHWPITHVELIRSQLGSGPAEYTVVARWSLAARESLANTGPSE